MHKLYDEEVKSFKNVFTKEDKGDKFILDVIDIINAEQECRKHPITRKINELLKPKGIM